MKADYQDFLKCKATLDPATGLKTVPPLFSELDLARLSNQIERVRNLMLDEKWRTLSEIETATGDPAASVSAQLRHLRKARFGSYTVSKRRRGDPSKGLFEYQVKPFMLVP